MGPFIKMIWVVAFALFAVLVLEVILFVGIRQERQAYRKTSGTEVLR